MDDIQIYGILLQLLGVLFAPSGPKEWKEFNDTVKFIEFEYVNGLYIHGVGLINGRGKGWWDISCRHHPDLKVRMPLHFWYICFSLLYTFGKFKILLSKYIFHTLTRLIFQQECGKGAPTVRFKLYYYYYYYYYY